MDCRSFARAAAASFQIGRSGRSSVGTLAHQRRVLAS